MLGGMKKEYPVVLTDPERTAVEQVRAAGTAPARKLMHARILLKADQNKAGPGWGDARIAEAVDVSQTTVVRVSNPSMEEGLATALNRRAPRCTYQRKLDRAQEARPTTLARRDRPAEQARCPLRLLADTLVELEVEDISYRSVRHVLKKTTSSHG
jgi:hypothetical protein